MSPTRTITLRYEVESRHDWALAEGTTPETQPHDLTVRLIRSLLVQWVARTQRDAQVARNLTVRWDEEHPWIGLDPDVCLIEPATPEGPKLEELRTWLPGHSAPRLAIEVVDHFSIPVSSTPSKDYLAAPERYAASGTGELLIFDARLHDRSYGGPHRIQLWRRSSEGFVRVAAGEGPFFVEALGAWAIAVDQGRRLRFADDRDGTRLWKTGEEAARAG